MMLDTKQRGEFNSTIKKKTAYESLEGSTSLLKTDPHENTHMMGNAADTLLIGDSYLFTIWGAVSILISARLSE